MAVVSRAENTAGSEASVGECTAEAAAAGNRNCGINLKRKNVNGD